MSQLSERAAQLHRAKVLQVVGVVHAVRLQVIQAVSCSSKPVAARMVRHGALALGVALECHRDGLGERADSVAVHGSCSGQGVQDEVHAEFRDGTETDRQRHPDAAHPR